MTITVETGSGTNAAANSYVSVANLQAYAANRGYTLPGTDAACEILLIKAMDYIEAQRERFQGYKVSTTQPLQWPRAYVMIDNWPVSTSTIPDALIRAQCELAVAAYTNTLQPTITPTEVGAVKRKRVEGAVDVEYFDAKSWQRTLPQFTAAEALLAVVCKSTRPMMIRA